MPLSPLGRAVNFNLFDFNLFVDSGCFKTWPIDMDRIRSIESAPTWTKPVRSAPLTVPSDSLAGSSAATQFDKVVRLRGSD